MTRTVTFKILEGKGLENSYLVPVDKPVQLALMEYKAYTDEACTTEWEEKADDSGMYTDEVIYLKRDGADTTGTVNEDSTDSAADSEANP